jgi:hypothetical protein
MRAKETNAQRLEKLGQALSVLPESVLEEITTAFEVTDPLSFARFLHSLQGLDDRSKGELLRCKIQLPPKKQDDLILKSMERAMQNFWQRLYVVRA